MDKFILSYRKLHAPKERSVWEIFRTGILRFLNA